jgi:hypothetical protein
MSKLIEVFEGKWLPAAKIRRISAFPAAEGERSEVKVVMGNGNGFAGAYDTYGEAKATAMDIALRANKLLP